MALPRTPGWLSRLRLAILASILAATVGSTSLVAAYSYSYQDWFLDESSGGEGVYALKHTGTWTNWSCYQGICANALTNTRVQWWIYDSDTFYGGVSRVYGATCDGWNVAYANASSANSGSFVDIYPEYPSAWVDCTVGTSSYAEWLGGMCDTSTDCWSNPTRGPHIVFRLYGGATTGSTPQSYWW